MAKNSTILAFSSQAMATSSHQPRQRLLILSRRLGNHLIRQARGGRGFVPRLAVDAYRLQPVAYKLFAPRRVNYSICFGSNSAQGVPSPQRLANIFGQQVQMRRVNRRGLKTIALVKADGRLIDGVNH